MDIIKIKNIYPYTASFAPFLIPFRKAMDIINIKPGRYITNLGTSGLCFEKLYILNMYITNIIQLNASSVFIVILYIIELLILITSLILINYSQSSTFLLKYIKDKIHPNKEKIE